MELYISNSGQEPIYAQITRQIKAKILNGELTFCGRNHDG